MGAGVKPKLVFVSVLLFFLLAKAAGAQVSGGTHSPHGNLAVPCQNCHTASAWKPIRAVPEFDHNQTRYPLRGMHAAVTCIQCHTKMVFSNVGQRCQDCHADIHRRQLGANCEQCHTVRGWQVANKDIQNHNNRFPLTGAHAAVDCDACHKNAANSRFQTMSTMCFSCHQSDFTKTTNPNHVTAKFSTACESCHSSDNWLNAKFDHSTTGFLLTGGHSVPPRECIDCHVNNNYNLTSTACFSCHQKDFASATSPVPHNGFPTTCENCHNTVQWTDAKFDHSITGFTLTGMHTVPPRQCADCHVGGNYNLSSTACVSCHLKDFEGTTSPNHVSANFPQTCAQCHDTSNWMNATFNHDSTGFPLTGLHRVPPRACTDCHTNGNYTLNSTTCVSCHLKDFQGTTNQNHKALNFSTTCDTCHTTAGWTPATFDHNSVNFPLTGAHTVPPRACTDCHTNNNFNLTTNTCVSCHIKDFQGTTNPNHVAGGFAQTCEICHNTAAWQPATFDHSKSGFPLTGSHTVPPRQCTDCHVNNNYNITNTTCISCHQTDYNTATSPVPHTGFPTTCQQCHDTVQWTDAKFDHSTTGFALTGLHTVPPRACNDCHVNNNYNLTSTACVSCHLKDYQGTTNPNHVTANFPQACDQCHDTSNWMNATFNHASTGFALTGMHTVPPRACTDCHVNNNYNLNTATCVSCHLKDYQGTTNPNHVTAKFPQTCDQCHDTTSWTDATFNHNSTGFPLTGLHTVPPRQCTDCHVNNNYNLTNTACVSCHQTDYNNATTPVNHIAAAFPTTCETCHDTVQWTNATFNHTSTGFQLTGAHTVPPRQCTDCHVNNNYSLNSTLCYSCHQKDYTGTTNPAHASAGFPTTCEVCHDTTAWTNSTFNHNNTAFPLTGAHVVPPRQCTDCHVNGNYTTLPTTCVGCHQTDYNKTTDPGHSAQPQFFPTTCQNCHNTSAWTGATFNHTQYTRFPINHGNANGACSTCHTNSNDYSVFQCTACHGGNNAGNFHHPNVNGYVYNSINCYQCHPSGNGG
jgi:hypothetical protein